MAQHWKQVSTLRPEDTYWGKPCNQCWATDAMSRNGQYYFYFSRGPEEIGVVRSDTPAGPWKDPLGKPLIAQGSTPTLARDPGILQEKDGTSYIVFGCWDFYIAKLNEDMISLAETPRKILLDRKMGPYGPGKMDDKPFLHKRRGSLLPVMGLLLRDVGQRLRPVHLQRLDHQSGAYRAGIAEAVNLRPARFVFRAAQPVVFHLQRSILAGNLRVLSRFRRELRALSRQRGDRDD